MMKIPSKITALAPMKGLFLVVLLIAMLTVSGIATAASIARASLIRGDVSVTTSAGESRALNRGDTVSPGDVIETGSKAVAQIVFADRSVLFIKSGSSVKLEEFRFAGASNSTGDDSAVTDLLKGGMRSITGLVGKSDPSKVIYHANDTTIGIRGTALEIDVEGNSTFVTFDYGKGFVETPRAGLCERFDLTQGDAWILTGSKAKRRFAERSDDDPAYVAHYLASANPQEARAFAATAAETMPLQDLMLTLGMMREVPLYNDAVFEASVSGMTVALPSTDVPTLLSGVTMAYPEEAPGILSAAANGNVDLVTATASVMCGLADQPDTTVRPVIDRAVNLGVTGAQAQQVLESVQSRKCWSS